jgi:hypothetical protein
MVHFQTKNPNLGIFWSLAMEDVGIFYGRLVYFRYGHLVNLVNTWYIFSRFGILYKEKSGNPVAT